MWLETSSPVLPFEGGPVAACRQNEAATDRQEPGSALWDDHAQHAEDHLNNRVLTNRQKPDDIASSAVGNTDNRNCGFGIKRHVE